MALHLGRRYPVHAVYNEHYLGGGPGAVSGRVSPLTGKPLFAKALGPELAISDFAQPEVSKRAMNAATPSLERLAFDRAPNLTSLGDLEQLVGRPIAVGEWLKVFWTELRHDGISDWEFDSRWPLFSAKFEIGQPHAHGSSEPVVSFINSLATAPIDGSYKDFDGTPLTFALRAIEVAASPIRPGSRYLSLANHPCIESFRHAQGREVTFKPLAKTPLQAMSARAGAKITFDVLSPAALDQLSPVARQGPQLPRFDGDLRWRADGVEQAAVAYARARTDGTDFDEPSLQTLPSMREVEFWFEGRGVGAQSAATTTWPSTGPLKIRLYPTT